MTATLMKRRLLPLRLLLQAQRFRPRRRLLRQPLEPKLEGAAGIKSPPEGFFIFKTRARSNNQVSALDDVRQGHCYRHPSGASDFGTSGLVKMPNARMADDGTLRAVIAVDEVANLYNITFQAFLRFRRLFGTASSIPTNWQIQLMF